MLTWIAAVALAGTPVLADTPAPALTLDAVLTSEGTPGEITSEQATARVATATSRLDTMLAQDGWQTATELEGLDASARYGPYRARLKAWTHADEWTYTPDKHAIVGGVAEDKITEKVWESSFVQSNVKLTNTAGGVSEVAFFTREIVGERMPSERTVAVWIRFEDGEPAEALVRSSSAARSSFTSKTHWTFTSDGSGGLTSATETEVITYGTPNAGEAPTVQTNVRTWGTPNS